MADELVVSVSLPESADDGRESVTITCHDAALRERLGKIPETLGVLAAPNAMGEGIVYLSTIAGSWSESRADVVIWIVSQAYELSKGAVVHIDEQYVARNRNTDELSEVTMRYTYDSRIDRWHPTFSILHPNDSQD